MGGVERKEEGREGGGVDNKGKGAGWGGGYEKRRGWGVSVDVRRRVRRGREYE